MSNENLKPTVPQMLRMTADNQLQFLTQIADHIDNLEAEVVRLSTRVAELEGKNEPN